MHGPINVKSLNNTSKWQMRFNSAFKWLINISVLWRCGVFLVTHIMSFKILFPLFSYMKNKLNKLSTELFYVIIIVGLTYLLRN
jgi:hypothetical protein